jgi:hypothetical protein
VRKSNSNLKEGYATVSASSFRSHNRPILQGIFAGNNDNGIPPIPQLPVGLDTSNIGGIGGLKIPRSERRVASTPGVEPYFDEGNSTEVFMGTTKVLRQPKGPQEGGKSWGRNQGERLARELNANESGENGQTVEGVEF